MESDTNEIRESNILEENINSNQEEATSNNMNNNDLTRSTEIRTCSLNKTKHQKSEDRSSEIVHKSSFMKVNQTLILRSPRPSLTLRLSHIFPTSSILITSQPRPSSSYYVTSSFLNLQNISIELPTLFQLCVARLNDSSISLSTLNNIYTATRRIDPASNQLTCKISNAGATSVGLCTPNSLTSAPPSYSFVLRQINIRRRPRLMGTFIPSPSFIIKPPPPTYGTAFDIYVDNPIPPPPRINNYGFTSMPVVCPECGYSGMSLITSRVTVCTHLCAVVLCIFCCWFCAPLPYVLRSCKNVYHYCRSCRTFLGMYCPTNPENMY